MIKNFKFHVSTAFLLFFALAVYAQSPADSTYFKREIGFGTNIILGSVFSSGGAPLDFMYRWKSGNGYMRLGASISYINEHSAYDNLRSQSSYQIIKPEVNIGKEWREQISKRWIFNYGSDLNLFYSANNYESKRDYLDQDGDVTLVHLTREHKYGTGIRPFIGIMFKINQRLVLGTEASFLVRAQRFVNESECFNMRNGTRSELDPIDVRKINGWNFQIFTQPANNIFVYYRF